MRVVLVGLAAAALTDAAAVHLQAGELPLCLMFCLAVLLAAAAINREARPRLHDDDGGDTW